MSEQVSFFSPIRLVGPFFNGCDFFVDQTGPTGNLFVDVNVETPKDPSLEREQGELVLHHAMAVRIRIRQEGDSPNDGKEMMRASVSMAGAVSVPDSLELPEEAILRALRINAVSLFYSSARSYVETLTGHSSMGRFTIPAIDPEAYIDSLKGGE